MWEERSERLAEVMGPRPRVVDLPLLKGIRLPRDLWQQVRSRANLYHGDCQFYAPQLPNKTPNGLLLPKREVLDSFNAMHRAFANCVAWAGVKAASAHLPINLRLSSGTEDPARDSRPRSSTKVHSDIWAGEPSAGVLLFLFLQGEHASQVRFYEPEDFPPEFQQPYDDYFKALFGRKDAGWVTQPYDLDLEPGVLYAADSFLLHKTERLGADVRTSIDVRVLPHKILRNDLWLGESRLENYVPFTGWFNGEVFTDISLHDPVPPDRVQNAYAQHYQMSLL